MNQTQIKAVNELMVKRVRNHFANKREVAQKDFAKKPCAEGKKLIAEYNKVLDKIHSFNEKQENDSGYSFYINVPWGESPIKESNPEVRGNAYTKEERDAGVAIENFVLDLQLGDASRTDMESLLDKLCK